MLNPMEIAMFKGRGFEYPPEIVQAGPRDVIARASKRVGNHTERAEALGRSEQDASRKLLAVVTRP